MSYDRWDKDLHREFERLRESRGEKTFAFDAEVRTQPRNEWRCHQDLDPKLIKGVRESCDSSKNPESWPFAVFFDVTGSMHTAPLTLQAELENLMDELVAAGIRDPQVLTGAVGDASLNFLGKKVTDEVPFQVSQFESDVLIGEHLRKLFLEGGGGPFGQESYGLAYYFAGWKTKLDSFLKRGKKGMLITIGDELPHDPITQEEIKRIFGDTVDRNISMREAVQKASETFEIFHLFSTEDGRSCNSEFIEKWKDLVGEDRVIDLPSPKMVCEIICGIVRTFENGNDPPTSSRNRRSGRGIKTPMGSAR